MPLKAQNVLEVLDLNDTTTVHNEETSLAAPTIMKKKWNQFKSKNFTLNIGVAVFLDYNTVSQDDNNIVQAGKIGNATEFRAERLVLTGTFRFFKYPWRYMISANYNGMDGESETPTFSVIDLSLEIPFGEKGGWLTIGKQKEGVGHEYVLPGSQAFFTERGSGVPAFVKQRNYGIRYSNSVLNNRMTYTVGLFNSWIEKGNHNSFADNGMQVTARVTGLPIYKSDAELMHFGLNYRYSDAQAGKLSYKARPEANTAPYFINTGSFDASASNIFMFEWIGVKGPVSFITEYMKAFISSHATGNPSFNYWQVAGSWFITGDHRNYNKQTGNLGKLFPKKNFKFKKGSGPGAFELTARYTKSNFTDALIDGGRFGRFTTGLGWFPNAHFRFEVNYGVGKLQKGGITGNANFLQLRAQFEL